MQTTSTLEAYNNVLANNVVHKGHFFKFIHDIRSEELLKSKEAEQLIESGGKTAKKRKTEWMVCQIVFFFQIKALIPFELNFHY